MRKTMNGLDLMKLLDEYVDAKTAEAVDRDRIAKLGGGNAVLVFELQRIERAREKLAEGLLRWKAAP